MLRVLAPIISASVVVFLAGCAGVPSRPIGIAPVINANDVLTATSNTDLLLRALAYDARLDAGTSPSYWYNVSVAGFDFVDDQCTAYFDDLFALARRRDATKTALTTFDKTSNAILFATKASQLSMAIVAQAFGLAGSLTDTIANTYLYSLPPATTQGFVRKVMKAQRDGIALPAKRATITTASAAYHEIQDYLSQCLPPTIEAMLVDHVSGASARPDPSGDVVVGTKNTFEELAILTSPKAPLSPTVKPPPGGPAGALTATERSYSITALQELQLAICAPVTGKWDSNTRTALKDFFQGVNKPRDEVTKTGLLPTDPLIALRTAITFRLPRGTCTAAGITTLAAELKVSPAFAVGRNTLGG